MDKKIVTVIDYSLGNLFSIERAINHIGAEPHITSDPAEIEAARLLILPGVGAFGEGMNNLNAKGHVDAIRRATENGAHMLGICLGMQLLMSESEELGLHKGLDLISGRVIRFPSSPDGHQHYKIPHIGWNSLHLPPHMKSWEGTPLDGLKEGDHVYFVHSFVVVPDEETDAIAVTNYAGLTYCSVIRKNKVLGCQFHPEKSGNQGLLILKNFIGLI